MHRDLGAEGADLQVAVAAGFSTPPVIHPGNIEHLYLHLRGALGHIAQLHRGAVRQVYDTVRVKGPAVVDPHHDAAAIFQVGDTGVRGNSPGGVCSIHLPIPRSR